MEINIAVVPVAGLGSRLLPATKSQPKEMLPVGRKPVVQYVVEELTRVGMQRILFITGPGKTSIENHFSDVIPSYENAFGIFIINIQSICFCLAGSFFRK